MPLRVRLTVWWTQGVMFAERWFAVLLWLGIGLMLLVALSWLGVWQFLPPVFHGVAVLVLIGAVGWKIWRHRRGYWWPGTLRAAHRAAIRSGVSHDPITTLRDKPISRTSQSLLLWDMNRKRAWQALSGIRFTGGDFPMRRSDPYGLRYIALALLLLGGLKAEHQVPFLTAQAFRPDWGGMLGESPEPVISAWLESPEYTGDKPLYLARDVTSPVQVWSGTRLHVDVTGGGWMVRIRANGRNYPLAELPTGGQQGIVTLEQGDRVAVTRWGNVLAEWPVNIMTDQPPKLELKAPSEAAARGTLRLPYTAEDDLGLSQLQVRVVRQKPPKGITGEELEMTPVPVFQPVPVADGTKKADSTVMLHLARLPWPGETVTVTLIARDSAGHVAESNSQTVQLPELEFRDPFARALSQLRDKLDNTLMSRLPVSFGLKELTIRPGLYEGDIKLFMGLRVATFRLHRDFRHEAAEEIREMLWDMAVYAEYGNSLERQKSLDEAMDALLQALDEEKGVEELDELVMQLQRRMMELFRDMPAQPMPEGAENALGQQMETIDMRDILAQAVMLYRSGAKEEARQLLKQLQDALRQASQEVSPEQVKKAAEAAQAAQKLQALIKQQEQLLNETFAESGDLDTYGTPRPDKAARQQELQDQLQGVIDQLKGLGVETPENLGKAGEQMGKAKDALDQGRMRRATGAQSEALQALREGSSQMQQQLSQQFGMQMLTFGTGSRIMRSRNGGSGSQYHYGDVKIPEQQQLQKSRQILEELFRRSNRKDAPTVEQEYIDRLLEPFK